MISFATTTLPFNDTSPPTDKRLFIETSPPTNNLLVVVESPVLLIPLTNNLWFKDISKAEINPPDAVNISANINPALWSTTLIFNALQVIILATNKLPFIETSPPTNKRWFIETSL